MPGTSSCVKISSKNDVDVSKGQRNRPEEDPTSQNLRELAHQNKY